MTGRSRSLVVAGLAAASLLSAFGAHVRLETLAKDRPAADHLLYLPSGKLLEVWSLGHRETLADLIYLWSIQFYGKYRGGVRYDHVMQIYDRVITELNPQFVDAYLLGALILAMEARRGEDALTLLDKGVRENPHNWMLPFEAGFISYHSLRDYGRAAAYFKVSMERPGALPVVRRFHAQMFSRMGDKRTSLRNWTEILETAETEQIRDIARKHVHDLTLEYHVQLLSEAVAAYQERTGSRPPHLQALVRAGLVAELPVDPEGRPYDYDPSTGQVSPVSGRLTPLPPWSRDP